MSMRFIFTADWHVHPWRECSRDGGQDRLADGLGAVKQLLQAARDRGCPLVVGGDVKHTPGYWVLSVLNGLLAVFEEFEDVYKVLLHGNHDGVGGGKSGLEPFRRSDSLNCWVFDNPDIATWGVLSGGASGEPVAIWPYQRTLDGLPAFLANAKKAKARVLFAHAFLSGAVVGPDYVTLKQGATLEQFGLAGKKRVFDYGLFGDIHKRQALGKRGDPQVLYPGSPLAQNWGETELDKGAVFVNLEKQVPEVETIPIQAPRFRVLDWTSATKAQWEGFTEGRVEELQGDFVRLIVDPRVDGKLLEQVREASGARAFQVIVQRESQVEKRADIHAGMDAGMLLRNYVQARPPADGLDPKMLLVAGKKLLEAK